MTVIKSKDPIFIIGVPRSGTTLLTSYLVSHSDITSGPETQFFNKIAEDKNALDKALSNENWPNYAYNLMREKLTLSNVSVLDLYGKSERDILDYLSNRSPSLGVMLESIVSPSSDISSSNRWLEKTPNHINHLDEIRHHFPSAKIILIHRDPRDSAASIAKLPWATKSTIANALLIEKWLSNTYSDFKESSNCHTVSYEKLVLDTEQELKKVFSFLGEAYDSDILNRKNASDVTTDAEPWKKDVHQKIDVNHISLWRDREDPHVLQQIESIMRTCLSFFSYKKDIKDEVVNTQLIVVNKQKFKGLDRFAEVLNNNRLVLTNEKTNTVLFYLESGHLVSVLKKALKLRLQSKTKVSFIGKKVLLAKFLGRYLD
ncbi:sulfotransferase [Alteromonas stellipolaris]|uniref:sulfotransferase family protein n=1 Tax=Alteromonas stellipolaris TaxID=233316 RepID=UPI0026E356C8|nr:sulfotransferase [Alteromonas stellipolaris]MDO6539762.1 sulfotransferase [Alteromonas stellipolaris]